MAAAAAAAAADGNFSEEEDDDDSKFPTDVQLALALRAVYAHHRHDLTLTRRTLTQKTETELGGADLSTRRRVIKTTIALIKHEEAEAEVARGSYAEDKPTAPDFDDDARDCGPCAISGVRIEEPAAAAVPAEVPPMEAPAEPAPPPAPAMADNSPLQAIDVVWHDDSDNRHPKEEIEGSDGGPWDYAIAVDDGELDIELDVEEAVRQDSFAASSDSGGGANIASDDDDNKEFSADAQLALALRAVKRRERSGARA